ncbi:MAG TPA: hypothetical protein VHM26_01695 [Chitinophagaceae bacterium]|jgi:hypothetical protein|nr:hypothetical protein [Chitinophagaceae bacterium]
METLPIYIPILFAVTTAFTIYLFYKATGGTRLPLIILFGWMIVQSIIGSTGFYTVTDTLPPRFLLTIAPPVLFIIALFATRKGRAFIDGLQLKWMTLLHVIRIPVEIVLLFLFLEKTIPVLMTFEGRNLDVLSGITAPVIYYFVFIKRTWGRNVLLVWNFICLGLLINIVAIAIMAAPFPFQQLAFEQPNIAVLYFPYILLPAVVVPLVLFSHLVAIRRLMVKSVRATQPYATFAGK